VKIFLAHGVLGFGKLLPVLPFPFPTIDYFNGVKRHLEARPDVEEVFAPSVDAVGSVETRSVQLARRIAAVPGPVHIIAHSMGGLDARQAIATHPVETARVRSLTTIGTPHRGSEVADAIVLKRGPLAGHIPPLFIPWLEFLAPALPDLTTERGAHFDDTTHDRDGLTYLEVAGDASQASHESLLFQLAEKFGETTGTKNDGVVTVESAKRTPRDLFDTWPFDHAGEVGWSLDLLLMPHLERYDKIVDELLKPRP
jgi:triacylglycerol lipase